MKLNELLNSDMTTIAGAVREGFDWWRAELAGLLPRRSALGAARPATLAVLATRGELSLIRNGQFGETVGAIGRLHGSPALFPADECLVRKLSLPAMSQRDLSAMLALDGDRYFPMAAGTSLFAASPPHPAADGTIAVDVAAWPVDRARLAADALFAAGITPSEVRPADPDLVPDARFDFLPAMRDREIMPGSGESARTWWIVVACLIALNLGMIVWRDSARLERMQELVDAQRPAAAVAQRIVQQMRSSQALAVRSVDERRDRDATGILGEVTRAVPNGAWVQRYAVEGNTLRLTGYRLPDVDVAAALRRSPRFASVKSAQSDQTAVGADGQPFDLVAELRSVEK